MGDKIVKISGGKGARRTENLPAKTWCGSGRVGCGMGCGDSCVIGSGKSRKKMKATRRNYEVWTMGKLLKEVD
jgi:hypothetical protein